MILNVYYLAPTQTSQTSFASWWPPHDVWNASGVNMNYWTLENESWYLHRLEKLRAGHATPISRQQWVKELRRGKETSTLFRENMNTFAAAVL